ncbi:hypothetical protein HK101_010058 [Irineochytrium annulatum]|nr:hypothetical protein HK101_010058 [Irineochytrium annulatum]
MSRTPPFVFGNPLQLDATILVPETPAASAPSSSAAPSEKRIRGQPQPKPMRDPSAQAIESAELARRQLLQLNAAGINNHSPQLSSAVPNFANFAYNGSLAMDVPPRMPPAPAQAARFRPPQQYVITPPVSAASRDAKLAQLMVQHPNLDVAVMRARLEVSNWDVATASAMLLAEFDDAAEDAEEEDDEDGPRKKRGKFIKKSAKALASAANHVAIPSLIRKPNQPPKFPSPTRPAFLEKSAKQRRRSTYSDEEEADAGDYSDGSDGSHRGGGGDDSDDDADTERNLATLVFFNTSSKQELVDTLLCSDDQADQFIEMRPFLDYAGLKTILSAKKKVLLKFISKYKEMMDGYLQVDSLICKCERKGAEIMSILKGWVERAPKPAATNGDAAGEVADVKVDVEEEAVKEESEDGGELGVSEIGQNMALVEEPTSLEPGKCLKVQPKFVNQKLKLKDYQLIGISWLFMLYRKGLGAILADEMGLGKTAQVITFLGLLRENEIPGPHLIIVPASTMENWLREFQKWVPSLEVSSYYGSQAERATLRSELMDYPGDVIVTTYTIASNAKEDKSFLKKMKFRSMILDEGHSESLNLIFNMKGLSGPVTTQNLLSKTRISRARKMMIPFVLRRKKAQVLKELPSKTQNIRICEPTERQRKLYGELVADCKKAWLSGSMAPEEPSKPTEEEAVEAILAAADEEKPTPRKRGRPKKAEAAAVKAAKEAAKAVKAKLGKQANPARERSNVLMQLRKVSCHPLLFRRLFTEEKIRKMAREIMRESEFKESTYDYVVEDMMIMSDFELHQLSEKYKKIRHHKLTESTWMDAGKVQMLKEYLPGAVEKVQ